MTSVAPHIKVIPSETSYFINVANMATNAAGGSAARDTAKVFNYNPAATAPVFSTATWASSGLTSTLLLNPGAAILRDLGKTVVSSLRTFRKVQLVVSSISSGVSIGAPVGSQVASGLTPVIGEEYFTGYIEVVGASGTPMSITANNLAPVARLG